MVPKHENLKLTCNYTHEMIVWIIPNNPQPNVNVAQNILFITNINKKNKGKYVCLVNLNSSLTFREWERRRNANLGITLFLARSMVAISGKFKTVNSNKSL